MCSLYYDSRCKCKLVYFFVQSLKSPQTKAEELIVIFEEFHVVFKVSFFVSNPVLCFSSLKNAKFWQFPLMFSNGFLIMGKWGQSMLRSRTKFVFWIIIWKMNAVISLINNIRILSSIMYLLLNRHKCITINMRNMRDI